MPVVASAGVVPLSDLASGVGGPLPVLLIAVFLMVEGGVCKQVTQLVISNLRHPVDSRGEQVGEGHPLATEVRSFEWDAGKNLRRQNRLI